MTKEEKGKEAERLLILIKNRALEMANRALQYEPVIGSDSVYQLGAEFSQQVAPGIRLYITSIESSMESLEKLFHEPVTD
jgi:hypothetical protein